MSDKSYRVAILSVDSVSSRDYGHLNVDLDEFYEESESLHDGLVFSKPFDGPLEGLRITNQYSSGNDKSYAWEVETNGMKSFKRSDMERAIKVLRKADRGIAKYRDEMGSPKSYREYVAVVLKSLGIKKIRYKSELVNPNTKVRRWVESDLGYGLSILDQIDEGLISEYNSRDNRF